MYLMPSCTQHVSYINLLHVEICRDSSVGITTLYGLEGPGVQSRWVRDFPHLSRPALGPTRPSMGARSLSEGGGDKAAGAWR